MRSCTWRRIPAIVLAALLTGCGGDSARLTTVLPPELLGDLEVDTSGGTASPTLVLSVTLWVGVDRAGEETTRIPVFGLPISSADEATTIRVDRSNNPSFEDAVALLTNGRDDRIGVARSGALPPPSGGGRSVMESEWIAGSPGAIPPDFAGAEITHVLVHVDRADVEIPGRDPSGNGEWIDFDLAFRVEVWGRPADGS